MFLNFTFLKLTELCLCESYLSRITVLEMRTEKLLKLYSLT